MPVSLAVEVARRRLRADTSLSERTPLSVNELADLLEFCLNATFLCFRGRTYQQTFGTAMGSPVSVTVANLVMEDVEERALATFDGVVPFWKRYVDDVCTAVPGDRIGDLLQHLNGIVPSISFTHEVESDSLLPFLDVLLHHQPDGSVSTSVYRKPSHTDKYLNFRSHHPPAHKAAVFRTLHSRALTHSSSASALTQESGRVSQALVLNDYPEHVLRHYLRRGRPRHPCLATPPTDWKGTAVMPYVRGVSESLRRILAPLRIRLCFKPCQTVGQLLSRAKDRVLDLDKSNIVYRVPCAGCAASYVGQTRRRLAQRLEEHKRSVTAGDFVSSALAEHAWTEGHHVSWDSVSVLASAPDLTTRLALESVHIRSTAHALNRDRGSLSSIYDGLL